MSVDQVATARRFNRVVSQRIGALEDHYLSEEQSLGEARVLFEIGSAGERGIEVGRLRAQLGLDSGYLSRLLRALESAALVNVEPSPADGRRRQARLTAAGEERLARLDAESNRLVTGILEPLTERQREQLVVAMEEVERLLTASMVSIEAADPESEDARACLAAFSEELGERFQTGFDPALSAPADPDLFRPPTGAFLVATLSGVPIACGALKHDGSGVGEIKRMWVARGSRGLGLGRRMLAALEQEARSRGLRGLRLETNGSLSEAVQLYGSAGYLPTARFGDDPYAEHWFAKDLG